MSTEMNPYAAPTTFVDDVRRSSESEAIRREHLKHEASVHSIGTLYYLGSVLLAWFGGLCVLIAVMGSSTLTAWPLAIVSFVLGLASFVVAWGLRRLKRWAGRAAITLSALSLPVFPLGTVLGAYVI